MIDFRNGREANASFALQSFFFLGNQDVRVVRLKDWLIFLEAVSYMVCGRIYSSIDGNQSGNYWPTISLQIAGRNLGPNSWSCHNAWASFRLCSVWAFYLKLLGQNP